MQVGFEQFRDMEYGSVWINPLHVGAIEERPAGVWIHVINGRMYGVQEDITTVLRKLVEP